MMENAEITVDVMDAKPRLPSGGSQPYERIVLFNFEVLCRLQYTLFHAGRRL